MSMLALLLAAATSTTPHCVAGDEAAPVLAATRGTPTPLGLIVGTGSDWGAKYLIVSTTHHLGVPGIPTREGATRITYYAAGRHLTCTKVLESSTCPGLDAAFRAYHDRSYAVMHNQSRLRTGAAYHPPFALLHAQDGDGNLTKIVSTQSEHPLMRDTAGTFADIASCTADVDTQTGQP
jgi:hypothetical protein